MNRTKRLAFTSVAAAGAVAILFLGRSFPTGQPTFAALASLLIAAVALDCGTLWGLAAYTVSAIIAIFVVPGTATWLYAAFFGFYPPLKLLFERRFPKVLAWTAKYLVLCGAAVVLWLSVFRYNTSELPILGLILLMVFTVFDIGCTRLMAFYKAKISDRITRK